MDVVLHYEDEYLLDWVYQKVSPGMCGVVLILRSPLRFGVGVMDRSYRGVCPVSGGHLP